MTNRGPTGANARAGVDPARSTQEAAEAGVTDKRVRVWVGQTIKLGGDEIRIKGRKRPRLGLKHSRTLKMLSAVQDEHASKSEGASR